MNRIFAAFILIAFATGAGRELSGTTGVMTAMSQAVIDASRAAVELALGLVGVMAFFLGLMKIAEQGGLLTATARLIAPLMRRLFPEVPPQHPAMGAMIMNFSANLLGLGNAATPFGIRAMQELDRLNPHPGVATDAMVRLLAINTSGLALLPTGVIALRAAAGSIEPAAILPTTLFATTCATLVAIFLTPLLARFYPSPRPTPPVVTYSSEAHVCEETPPLAPLPRWVGWTVALAFVALIAASVRHGQIVSAWIVPTLVVGFIVYGLARGVAVYESFVDGAKEGFQVALRIIPYLVAILAATALAGMLAFGLGAHQFVATTAHAAAWPAWTAADGRFDEARAAYEDYSAQYKTAADFAEEMIRETGTEIPASLQYYIDWQALARDMALNGEILVFQTGFDEVHVFWSR